MSTQVDQILQAALSLPDEDQLRLLIALEAAVDERGLRPFEDSWLTEIRRRSAEYDAGTVRPTSWSEVKERARHRIAQGTPRG